MYRQKNSLILLFVLLSLTAAISLVPTHVNSKSATARVLTSLTNAEGLSLIPASIDFGPRLIGTSSPQTLVTWTNTSNSPVVLREVSVLGRDRADFAAAYDFTLPLTVAPDNSVPIKVSFAPAPPWRKGTRDAKLRIKYGDSEDFVSLTGMSGTCAGAVSSYDSGGLCADTDGDGFNDLWEDNDYIDINNNLKDDKDDFHFPHRASFVFTPVSHSGSGRGQVFPTVIDPTLPIGESAVNVTIASSGNLNEATFTYTINGALPQGPLRIRAVVDLGSNLRLMFYLTNFVAGDTYTFTTSMSPETKIADKNVPNIYVQYDYMDWSEPGAACSSDGDCADPNDVCHQGFCSHNHAPGDPLFRKVVDQFAAHGITLYINPVHQALPHAVIVTFAKASDLDNGPRAICAGRDIVAGDISNGNAVSFFDIKNRLGSDFANQPFRRFIYRYAVFGHLNTCLTDKLVAGVGNCNQCPVDRSMPPGESQAGGSGKAELPGNDFMVTMAQTYNNPLGSVPRNPFTEGGVFMHELGHTLGLHHAGDVATPDGAPNYLSVMNSKYVFSGIQHAATPGSAVAVESLREINFSEHILNTLDESHLDGQAGVSPLSAGYTGIVRFFNFSGDNGVGPESGPINWDGFPPQSCTTNADCLTGQASLTGLCLPSGFCEVRTDLNLLFGISETMNGYSDWIHGPCTNALDCRINLIRQAIHDTVDPTLDPHESCVRNRCQSLWFPFQFTQWGRAD